MRSDGHARPVRDVPSYAGASGDFNPIHLDDEFARSVGLPGRILHGLWTMAQVARAHGEAAGDPHALKSLRSSSAVWACPEKEITVTSTVARWGDGDRRRRGAPSRTATSSSAAAKPICTCSGSRIEGC